MMVSCLENQHTIISKRLETVRQIYLQYFISTNTNHFQLEKAHRDLGLYHQCVFSYKGTSKIINHYSSNILQKFLRLLFRGVLWCVWGGGGGGVERAVSV